MSRDQTKKKRILILIAMGMFLFHVLLHLPVVSFVNVVVTFISLKLDVVILMDLNNISLCCQFFQSQMCHVFDTFLLTSECWVIKCTRWD